ncbi:MAG: ABC transporter permease [Hyphomicrobiales bacterium]
MNYQAVKSIYVSEMMRAIRTVTQSLISPVLSTSLYFVVFGTAIGSRMNAIDGVEYGTFIVPGLIMLSVLGQSIANASFGIYFPKFTGSIYEIHTAPISAIEILIGYVGAAASKSLFIGLVTLATASLFVPLHIVHPVAMFSFLVLTCVGFSLFGFIIGLWAKNFEQLSLIPLLVITPLVFLGGTFYSISMLPPFWQNISFFNPVVYLVSGFRWSFFGIGDLPIATSLTAIGIFIAVCASIIWWTFHTGYKIKE